MSVLKSTSPEIYAMRIFCMAINKFHKGKSNSLNGLV